MASPCAFPRYKPIERSPRLLPVVLADQVQSGSLEFALDHFICHELDLSALDARFRNEQGTASRATGLPRGAGSCPWQCHGWGAGDAPLWR